jgi:hypothetical protein
VTDTNGNYSFSVECGKHIVLELKKAEYTQKKKNKIASSNGKSYLPIARKEICKVAIGDDLGKCFKIKMIYFDLDKSTYKKLH